MTFFGNIGIQRIYRLRWRFDFLDKPTRTGIWNNVGNSPATSAWNVNKTGLIRACIEAESNESFKTIILAECDGHDFVNFRWVAATPLPWGGEGTFQGQIIGLAIDTRDHETVVYVDGNKTLGERSAEDKAQNLAGF